MTYTEYLQHLRLQKAEELLLHTRLTIDAIAAEVGYKNKGYFYKIFTERHRMTPAQFRKESVDILFYKSHFQSRISGISTPYS